MAIDRDPNRRLKMALFGLGRLGAIRAQIMVTQQPRIELVAVSDPKPGAEDWAAAHLPASVKYYADPDDCMRHSGAEAILISSGTATHAPLICLGLDLGLHVMCEKPISTDLIATKDVIAKAASKPHLKFLVPFSRRYDESYMAAKRMVDEGAMGIIHAVETTGMDPQDPTGFFVSFSAQSGGIFLDCGIHDVSSVNPLSSKACY